MSAKMAPGIKALTNENQEDSKNQKRSRQQVKFNEFTPDENSLDILSTTRALN